MTYDDKISQKNGAISTHVGRAKIFPR